MTKDQKDYLRIPETGEFVPTFPALPREDKAMIAAMGDSHQGNAAMRLLMEKTKCSELEAKLWVLYRAKVSTL